ncbi:centrosomal protein of 97 kDa isoform X2 [Teleopsis dalmanni]|uniref:centrosomal protein of 97 kDa isoform X2 n=1 Tax=Teleopsis dalmanni TaxID=139649 RepID=UPI0018CE73AD|nr:centrosomal protein of 97 kDa isoform X2 [Teleopsis dalmanni]
MSDEELEKAILDLSKKQLKKVPKDENAHNVRVLILDENELQKIDNIDSYLKIENLSLSKNQLLRMYGVCRLHCLRELNLSFNGILSIEGLKDCIHLRQLNLEGNNIKTIEHLNSNVKLEHLNLAENSIGSISDISHLKCLKELHLYGNRLTHLRQCDKHLPQSLEILTLAKNNINDLNEICTLSNLTHLQSITISENPCLTMTAGADGFDHRPFVLNWIMSLKVIDGFLVDPIESLKAEWLYSQGRGRQFRLGEQASLAKYLSTVCPLIGKALENENERKLRLILSKAQQHQRQLQEEISENSNTSGNNSPSSGRKKGGSRIQSPRFSRLTGRQSSPESMISSYHGNTSNDQMTSNHYVNMTTSLIENIKNDSVTSGFEGNMSSSSISNTNHVNSKANSSHESSPRTSTPNPYHGGPLAAASKMVPVPETLMSPDVCPVSVAQRVTVSAISSQIQNSKINKNKENKLNSPKMRSPHLKRNSDRSMIISPRKINNNNNQQQHNSGVNKCTYSQTNTKSRLISNIHVLAPDNASSTVSSDDDSEHINVDKLRTIRNKAAQRCQEQKSQSDSSNISTVNTEYSAVIIQKTWRGYHTRKKTKDLAEKLLKKRTYEYIDKLTKDMEMTKAQLENERKIQQLQMQAINALWKKVSTMQISDTGSLISNDGTAVTSENSKPLSLDDSSAAAVQDLARTCAVLTNQVQQLQGSMRDILNCLAIFCNLPRENVQKLLSASINNALSDCCGSAGTQTEITAVHTPQTENQSAFPFYKMRPSSLPLEMQKHNNSFINTETHLLNKTTEPHLSETENEMIDSEDAQSTDRTYYAISDTTEIHESLA